MDTAPARSAELLAQGRVDAALVPVIAYQMLDDVKLVPDVCVGSKLSVRSVCLVTKGEELSDVKRVSLDVSSKTSVALTKIIFREFLGFEPVWIDAEPNLSDMLHASDAALIIGDPALAVDESVYRKYDLAELWHEHTGLGFVFAMWMTKKDNFSLDLAAARDEGLKHIDDIAANYASETGLGLDEIKTYLTTNISFSIDDAMRRGMELYFELAAKHALVAINRELLFL